jgi:2-iminobutanoate/2-iminopropanoate deaminase
MSPPDARPIARTPDPYERICLALGYRVGELIFLSGHASLDDHGRFVPGDFAAQATLALRNLEKALQAAGASLDGVVKLNAYLTEIRRQRPVLLELIPRWFRPPWPALVTVGVHMRRHPEWLIEMDLVAVANGRRR